MLDHPAFKSPPTLGQFAKNGQWETAWSFAADAPPSQARIDAYLDHAGEVAFEVFFGDAFFGLRLNGSAEEVRDLAGKCAVALARSSKGSGFFKALVAGLGKGELGQELAFAEIGAVNAWKSVGAFRIDQPAALGDRLDGIWGELLASSVGTHRGHRKAIEFACREPIPHWFALPVSDEQPPFALSYRMLQRAAKVRWAQRR